MSFVCHTEIDCQATISDFLKAYSVGEGDLVLSNRYTFDPERHPVPGARLVWQEDYGPGEPDDRMMAAILRVAVDARRVIGIGGGTVLDIAKILSLETNYKNLHDLFSGAVMPRRKQKLILVPTTCGTGSEVTNVAVVAFTGKGVKLGLAHSALFADRAVLVPEFLETLPFRPFAYSAIDALVHATEAFLSPQSDAFTRLFSREAIATLIAGFEKIAAQGPEVRREMLASLQIAACQAGLAFGNAGCGCVHAMSYPIGGEFHIAHGEANYALFITVLRYYEETKGLSSLDALKDMFAQALDCAVDSALSRLDALLARLIPRKSLLQYGMSKEQIPKFAELVMENQHRLLKNSPVFIDRSSIERIYESAHS